MLRGNNRERLFSGPPDFACFERLIAEGVERYEHCIHAYCWMTNHVHMAVQVAGTPLAAIIRSLAGRYARYVNTRDARVGHLFQGRYRAKIVEVDTYLLTLVRYIHLNPVAAGLARDPEGYRWSSHPAYVRGDGPAWLTTDFVLQFFGRSMPRRRFGEFVASKIGIETPPEFAQGGWTRTLPDVVEIVSEIWGVSVERMRRLTRCQKVGEARAAVAFLARHAGIARPVEVARYFERSPSTISTGLHRLERDAAEDAALAGRMELAAYALRQPQR